MLCMNIQKEGTVKMEVEQVRLVAHPGLGRQGRQAKGTSRWSGDIGNYTATLFHPNTLGRATKINMPQQHQKQTHQGKEGSMDSLYSVDWATSQRLGEGTQRVGRDSKTEGKRCWVLWTKTLTMQRCLGCICLTM